MLNEHGAVSQTRSPAYGPAVLHSRPVLIFCLSTTGVAGPGGEHRRKPVGTVWIGLLGAGNHHLAPKATLYPDRLVIKERSAVIANGVTSPSPQAGIKTLPLRTSLFRTRKHETHLLDTGYFAVPGNIAGHSGIRPRLPAGSQLTYGTTGIHGDFSYGPHPQATTIPSDTLRPAPDTTGVSSDAASIPSDTTENAI